MVYRLYAEITFCLFLERGVFFLQLMHTYTREDARGYIIRQQTEALKQVQTGKGINKIL